MDIDELMRSLSQPKKAAEELAQIRAVGEDIDEMIRNLSKPSSTCKPCGIGGSQEHPPAVHRGIRGSLDKFLESLKTSRPR